MNKTQTELLEIRRMIEDQSLKVKVSQTVFSEYHRHLFIYRKNYIIGFCGLISVSCLFFAAVLSN
jgi:hypothetical protein